MTEEEQQVLFSDRDLFMMFLSCLLLRSDGGHRNRSNRFDGLAKIDFTHEYHRYNEAFGDPPEKGGDPRLWIEEAWRHGFIELAVEAKSYLDRLNRLLP